MWGFYIYSLKDTNAMYPPDTKPTTRKINK